MAGEVDDEDGNCALHLFLLNNSYTRTTNDVDATKDNVLLHTTEINVLRALIDAYHNAISIRNAYGEYPIDIAMRTGRRHAVSILLTEYPDAVLHNDSMFNVHHYVHIIGCISTPISWSIGNEDNNWRCPYDDVECQCLTIMFNLLRARPEIVSVASSNTISCNGNIGLRSNDTSKKEEKKDGRRNGGLTLRGVRRKVKLSW
jgi:ankyrin repeat protein